jgi:hypothetical protein
MAPTAPGTYTEKIGFGDTWGGQFMQAIEYTAAATSYTGGASGGEGPIDSKAFGCPNSLRFLIGGISDDCTLIAEAQPVTASGNQTKWNLRYYVSTTGAEVANAQSVAGKKFILFGFGI